jgi:hypothetical protein
MLKPFMLQEATDNPLNIQRQGFILILERLEL